MLDRCVVRWRQTFVTLVVGIDDFCQSKNVFVTTIRDRLGSRVSRATTISLRGFLFCEVHSGNDVLCCHDPETLFTIVLSVQN